MLHVHELVLVCEFRRAVIAFWYSGENRSLKLDSQSICAKLFKQTSTNILIQCKPPIPLDEVCC